VRTAEARNQRLGDHGRNRVASRASARSRVGSAPAGLSSCVPKRRACSAPVSPPSPVVASRATYPRGGLQRRKGHPAKRMPRRSLHQRCRGAVAPPGQCQVRRGCRPSPLCLLPATRPPHPGGHRSNGMRAMDQADADAPCIRERVDRAVKAALARARRASRNHRSGSRGPPPDSSPSPPSTTGRPPHRAVS
jgi:hypothetical protein